MENKEATLAAALNLFTWGGGYLYLGQRTYSALGLVAAWLLAMAWTLPRWLAGDPMGLMDAALFTMGAALGYDAYEYAAHHGHDADAADAADASA